MDMMVLQDIVKELGIQDSEAVCKAQRIGKIDLQKSKPRLLRVECSSVAIRSHILRASKGLMKSETYSSIYLNPDLTFEERKERRALRALLRERREAGEEVIIYRGEVVPKKNIQNFQLSS